MDLLRIGPAGGAGTSTKAGTGEPVLVRCNLHMDLAQKIKAHDKT
jgi:hypothetical protein